MPTATKVRAAKAKPLPFNKTLVLNQWVLGLFGVASMDELAGHLKADGLEGLDDNNVSRMRCATAPLYHTVVVQSLNEPTSGDRPNQRTAR